MSATLKLTHKTIGVEVRRGTYDAVVDGKHAGTSTGSSKGFRPATPRSSRADGPGLWGSRLRLQGSRGYSRPHPGAALNGPRCLIGRPKDQPQSAPPDARSSRVSRGCPVGGKGDQTDQESRSSAAGPVPNIRRIKMGRFTHRRNCHE